MAVVPGTPEESFRREQDVYVVPIVITVRREQDHCCSWTLSCSAVSKITVVPGPRVVPP